MPLRRQITSGETWAERRHSARVHSRIERSTKSVNEKLRKQQWANFGFWLSALKVPEFRLRAYRNKLIATKLDFLLWRWNWVCAAMVQEWHDERAPEAKGLRGNPAIWTIEDWTKILGPCAEEDGDYTFDSDSVKTRLMRSYSRNLVQARTCSKQWDIVIGCAWM